MVIKIRLRKSLTKGGITKPINECESYAGGVAGYAFKLCFHDTGNFMPGWMLEKYLIVLRTF